MQINDYIHTLQNSIIPKFLALIENPEKRQLQRSNFTLLLPKNTLDISTEDYIDQHKISKRQIIINSINQTTLKLPDEELDDLSSILEPLCNNFSLRIFNNTGTATYLEILNIISYAVQIRDIINSYPKRYSNHHGTKYRSSSEKNLIKTQRSHLVERLENPFFALDDDSLIEMTQMQIKYMDMFMSKEHKTLPNIMNIIESIFGLDSEILDFPPLKIKALRQVLSLFNGIRTSKEALVKSVMIFTLMQSKLDVSDIRTNKIYAKAIYKFTEYLFHDIFIEDGKKKKKTLVFNHKTITAKWYSKTVINDLSIFAFNTNKQEDFIIKYIFEGLADMLKVQSVHKNDNEISNFAMLRNFYHAFYEIDFTNQDINTLIKISQSIDEQSLLIDN